MLSYGEICHIALILEKKALSAVFYVFIGSESRNIHEENRHFKCSHAV